jgi:hypothetical protein
VTFIWLGFVVKSRGKIRNQERQTDIYIEIFIFILGMDLTIVSNLVKDTIVGNDGVISQALGGPPCYAGLMAREFGFNINLVTRYGKDLMEKDIHILKTNGLSLRSSGLSDLPTTKFVIHCLGRSRKLVLESKCDKVRLEDVMETVTDGWLISPVFDEVSQPVLDYIRDHRGDLDFVMLDPQGFTRVSDDQGTISTRNEISLDFKGMRAIKLDPAELACLTGGLSGVAGIKRIVDHNHVDYLLYTDENAIHAATGDTHYWLKISDMNIPDSTGIGDILSSTFSCTFMKENDVIWAFCFAVGAAVASLNLKRRGLEKIPKRSKVEENAAYFYAALNYEKF